jgi:hypothetical protein
MNWQDNPLIPTLSPMPKAMKFRPSRVRVSALLALAALSSPVWAQDHADIDRTQIIGNRELPKVLYIVPWKKPVPGALSGRPLVSVLDEALAPVDRDVFRRQMSYGALIHPAPTGAVAPAAPAVR